MARFLIGTVPYVGHVNQAFTIASKLTERGHEVWWYTGKGFRSKVEAAGATYVPMTSAPDFSEQGLDSLFPGRKGLTGLAKLRFEVKHVFIDGGVGQYRDIQEVLKIFPADVLLCERAFLGGAVVHEKGGPPWASYSISVLPFNSQDTAPIGLGLPPNNTPLGRIRNRMLNWLATDVLFRDVQRHANRVRTQLGLPRLTGSYLAAAVSPYLYLQGTTEAFEYPRSDLPPQVHFVGPFLPEPPKDFAPPSWWPELQSSRSVVHVTQGTVTTAPGDLIVPTIQALAEEDILVVVTTGGLPVDAIPLATLPENVRVERFLPHYCLMPYVDLMISNGGYVAVQIALANGVPIIVAGKTEEKADIAARVTWAGVGINLNTKKPTPRQIANAVRQILTDPRYRSRAQAVQQDFAKHDAPTEAALLLEELARIKRPIYRLGARNQQ